MVCLYRLDILLQLISYTGENVLVPSYKQTLGYLMQYKAERIC